MPVMTKIPSSTYQVLVPKIAECLIKFDSPQLRHSANSLLFKLCPRQTATDFNLSPDEFSIWILTLECQPRAVSVFSRIYTSLLVSRPDLKERMKVTFDAAIINQDELRLPCSPLILIAWDMINSSKNQEDDDIMVSYISAVTCELTLAHGGPLQPFADALMKSAPEKLKSKSKKFFSLISERKRKPVVPSQLGLSVTASMLCASCFSADIDWKSLIAKWEEVMSLFVDRMDLLQVALKQTINCLHEFSSDSTDQVNILGLLKIIIDMEEKDSSRPLLVQLLEDARAVNWFNPIALGNPFSREYSAFVQNALKLIPQSSLHQIYNKKFNEAIASGVTEETRDLPCVEEGDLFFSLSHLKIDEIEPQILLLVARLKKKTEDNAMRFLNVYLRLAAKLRLEGVLQRISWSTFSPALQLFVSLRAPVNLQRGIYDVLSVCPEFFSSTDKITNLMKVCLNSPTDHTSLCQLAIASSDQLCSAFGQLCLAKEEHFEEISWRVQILPAYLSSQKDDLVFDMLNRKMSPALKRVMTTRSEYEKVAAQFDKLPELVHILVSKCWSVEDCRQMATDILANFKKELNCAQFVEAGRRGTHHQLHAKLCLLAAVRQLKSDNPNPREIEQLAHEFDWLSKQTHTNLADVTKSILENDQWNKFVKYTLRIGLHASDTVGSILPPLALQLMTSMWRLLLQGPSEEITALSLKVNRYVLVTLMLAKFQGNT